MGNALDTDVEKLRRRNRELSILNSIAQALNRSVDLDQALKAALAQVADLLDLRTGWIWLLHEETGESYLAAAQNLPPGLANNPRRMEGSCYCLDTYRAGDLDGAANVNVITCSRLRSLVDGTGGLRYHASIPLYALGGESLKLPAGGRARLLAPRDPQLRAKQSHGLTPVRLWLAVLELPRPKSSYLEKFGSPIRYKYVKKEWPISYYQTVYATEMGSAEMPPQGGRFRLK
jgi:hypothetical protein